MSELSTTDSDIDTTSDEYLEDLIKKDYTYPSPSDSELQKKIYRKREFYYHKLPERPKMKNYSDIREFRDNVCGRKFALHEHQSFLSNFINPDTPYKGILIFHGTGTGKCILPEAKVCINNELIEAEKIWDLYKTDDIITDKDNGYWCNSSKDIYVKSLDEETKKIINNVRVNRLYRQYVIEYIKHVKLSDNKQIKLTGIHKLLTETGWTNKFQVGNYVCCPNDKNDIYYSKIVDIRYEYYHGYVYDFEIEPYHNYVAEGIICHNTCASITIAEKFKSMVQKYGTKIYVLVSGPLIKDNWRNELLKCTGETYLKYQDKTLYIDEVEKSKAKKNAYNLALQYYRFMSYRSFYKKVLGEKIVDRRMTPSNKTKVSYRKTDKGEFERDIAVDRIYNLNNSIIIIDEAHNLTGNAYGEALLKVIKASKNLRVVLLTATPMKNRADDIVELVNFLRPPDNPIQRDKIFTSQKNHEMEFKEGGEKYLAKMTQGYISYLRGADPLTFAKREEKGEIPDELIFTKIIKCKMLPFQRKIYDEAIREKDDTLDRRSEAVANFAFPGLSDDKKSIIGYYGKDGILEIRNQLKSHYENLNKKIGTDILKDANLESESDLIYLSENNKTISGKILKHKYLKYFSIKFYTALKKLNRLVWGRKGPRIAFVYSNLVKVGIEIFEEILLQNGYLEYQENAINYSIKPNTVCYFCGKTFKEHQSGKLYIEKKRKSGDDESSTEYELQVGEIPEHKFHPATYISVTGKSAEESAEVIPEDKRKMLDNVFNNIDNKEGKYIKLVLGSKVMNEGISLANVSEVHILDVYFNLGKVDQVIGRAIRICSHYSLINDNNRYPKVKVYKYAVTLEKGLSSEEELYKKAELKYLLIKQVERIIKRSAIDCPLNRHGNLFDEEMKEFEKCGDKGEVPCPAICDYMRCEFQCIDKTLNNKYYDPERKLYRKIARKDLDVSTFTHGLARDEIEITKKKIKELYKTKYAYTLENILAYVKNTYSDEKRDLFDEFFVYKALDELIPLTENDFNNFKDTILDKFNRPGYLIHVNKYYIFQPFDQNNDVPMYYRTTYNKPLVNKLTLRNYLKNSKLYLEYKGSKSKKQTVTDGILKETTNVYDFDTTLEYYDNRDEFKYVGIIDKEASRRKTKHPDEMKDVFKIREMRDKILEKKRGTGIPSLKGAVCSTSKSKEYLEQIASEIKANMDNTETRTGICDSIRNKLLELEKYSTGKNKITYIMIPANHAIYKFPYNLEDRIDFIKQKISDTIKVKIDLKVNKLTHKSGEFKGKPYYEITVNNTDKLNEFKSVFEKLNAKLEKGHWIILVE